MPSKTYFPTCRTSNRSTTIYVIVALKIIKAGEPKFFNDFERRNRF